MHQDSCRFRDQSGSLLDEVEGYEDGDGRINPVDVPQSHGQTTDHHGDGGQHIGEQMQVGGFDIHIFMGILFDEQYTYAIEHDTKHSQPDYQCRVDRLWMDEFTNNFDDEENTDPYEHRSVKKCR